MFGRPHHFSTLILALVLIFGIILIIISLSIIDQNRGYADLYRPELGLASFNIVISSVAIIIGCVGICVSLVKNPLLPRIVAFVMIVIEIFAVASLITALIINALSPDYLRNHFNRKMSLYSTDSTARNIVDQIQSDCQCCGFNSWLDYSLGQLTSESSESTSSTSSSTTQQTSTETANVSSPPSTTISESSSTPTTGQVRAAFSQATENSSEREIAVRTALMCPKSDEDFEHQWIWSRIETRQRRPSLFTNRSMISASVNVQFSVPFSCCLNISSEAACSAASSGSTNQFYQQGCSACIITRANKHNMGIAILNSFLIILAGLVIPILFNLTSRYDSTDNIDDILAKDSSPNRAEPVPDLTVAVFQTRH